MNNSAINKELAVALRNVLPFVPVGSTAHSAAQRALVDHDERVARENREQAEFVLRVMNALQVDKMARLAAGATKGVNEFVRRAADVGYLPAAAPKKGCNCLLCVSERAQGLDFSGKTY